MEKYSVGEQRQLISEVYRRTLEMMNSDKRQFKRVSCEIPSSFRDLDDPSSAGLIETCVSNISEGGVAFRTNRFIPVKNRLSVQLNVPKHRPITVRLQPAWITENTRFGQYEIGARFIDLSPDDRNLIRSLIYPRIA